MAEYNAYASGSGGVCADVWGWRRRHVDSYWCSNASAGGWAEVDRECAVTGRLQLPVGMTVKNAGSSVEIARRMRQWKHHHHENGMIVHAWHSQSWAMHMFQVTHMNGNSLEFAPGGGRQGGRNWCRCDQCTYAGAWCGQRQDPPDNNDDRLISGNWLVENVLYELDQPGEYYFDRDTNLLYVYPNQTAAAAQQQQQQQHEHEHYNTDSNSNGPHQELRLGLLETLISIEGAANITLSHLGFRDSAATYLSEWGVPSGGDWALHRGGAVFVERARDISIHDCIFRRLDANAVFLSRWTRNVSIRRSVFEWLGENAIALWGDTNGYNATDRRHPLDTVIEGNAMRELGIYQKQSSAVAQAKAARTTIRNNIMFNMPRAAINFNDHMGGGDLVEQNLIFNTCRESGDHGPINTWDRQPFLTDLRNGTASFVPLRRTVALNFIIANYNAGWGLDNDDGSSWYHVRNNVFYESQGFKMDYGGHDSVYEDNVVITFPSKWEQACVGFGSFFEDHWHVVRRNICVVPKSADPIVLLEECRGSKGSLHDNHYYTPDGKATAMCGYGSAPIPFQELQSFGIEIGSKVHALPSQPEVLVEWAINCLFPGILSHDLALRLDENMNTSAI